MKNLSPDIKERVQKWLQPPFNEETRRHVQHLLETDPEALVDLFYTTISFGTGGMRGLMDVGTNRMNQYTIRRATQGLAHYILQQQNKCQTHRVFIGYDCRKNSRLFAEEAARVLAANRIEVYLTKELRPTPFVSFGCRHLKCTAAIMITASHNPSEYNGYKVYWEDGGQVVPPHDQGIIEAVKKIQSQKEIELAPFDHPMIHEVSEEVDQAYYQALIPLQNHPADNQNLGQELKIIYSSLHGTGITLMPQALKNWGFTSLSFVKAQITPDGTFPSIDLPNPEKKEALQLGSKQLIQEQADLLLATDPDADRIGVVINHQGTPVILSGNQIASLCVFYLCQTLSTQNKMPENGAVVTTIVTTELFSLIASRFHLTCFQVLTGFKYIGEKIHQWEQSLNSFSFLFGAEESLGYLYGTHARDKDAIIAGCLICEMALQQKKIGKTLIDLLCEIYHQFGLFQEKQLSIAFGSGQEDVQKIEKIMSKLRSHPPKEISSQPIIAIEDYQIRVKTYLKSGHKKPLTLPQSNVLVFLLEDHSKFVIRPSGTEPKIKIYGMVRQKFSGHFEQELTTCEKRLDQMLEALKKCL